ncbi:MAG: STAS domain-containing protein [Sphingobacteriales bacterium]|nr:MAG: STAS domain-containing protein [Sphingobacteriales bacterium]
MNVKTDTKEKFSVITLLEQEIPANMTEELKELLLSYLQKDIPHLVLKMNSVAKLSAEAGETIALTQQKFYENNASFVICEMASSVEDELEKMELLEIMNTTPTESEAWDIVQMEEIERELLGDFDEEP